MLHRLALNIRNIVVLYAEFLHLLSSQAIVADRTVYCSGVLGMELDTLKLVPGGAAAQTAKALEHLTNLLSEAGSGIDKVVKTTVLLGDMNDYATVNEEYKKGNAGGEVVGR